MVKSGGDTQSQLLLVKADTWAGLLPSSRSCQDIIGQQATDSFTPTAPSKLYYASRAPPQSQHCASHAPSWVAAVTYLQSAILQERRAAVAITRQSFLSMGIRSRHIVWYYYKVTTVLCNSTAGVQH
jgi:hypothetical protein